MSLRRFHLFRDSIRGYPRPRCQLAPADPTLQSTPLASDNFFVSNREAQLAQLGKGILAMNGWVRAALPVFLFFACAIAQATPEPVPSTGEPAVVPVEASPSSASLADEFVLAAREMAAYRIRYRMNYPRIGYPGGDVSPNEGLCCDVVVRALRACGVDLQELVYEDVKSDPAAYRSARRAAVGSAMDASWMHRRTAYLDVFFKRHAEALTTHISADHQDQWRAGDIVIFKRHGWETWHIAIVADSTSERVSDRPLVDAWSEPGYVSEDNRLADYGTIGGHYRLPDGFRDSLTPDQIARARESWARFLEAHVTSRLAKSNPSQPLAHNSVEN